MGLFKEMIVDKTFEGEVCVCEIQKNPWLKIQFI